MKNLSGITLVEMMMALLISMALINMLMTLYISVKKNFRTQKALSQLQNNARTAIELLQSDLQIAGWIGCIRLGNQDAKFPELNVKNKIEITNNTITVRHADVQNGNLVEDMIDTENIMMSQNPIFVANDCLIISDCRSMEIMYVKKVNKRGPYQHLIPQTPLSKKYGKYAEISKLIKSTYFIDKTKREAANGQPIFALYKLDSKDKKNELVEGIHSMKTKWIGSESDPKGIAIELQLVSDPFIKTWYTQIRLR